MTFSCPPEFIALAHTLADQARPIALKYFHSALAIDQKKDASPVTIADREIETLLTDIIKKTCPSHGIIGEEYGTHNPDAEWQWLLDPIDGTRAFSVGYPTFGVLIALKHRTHGFVLGVCDNPVTEDRWLGVRNEGAYMNGKRVHTRATTKPEQAIFACTDPLRLPAHALALVQKLRPNFRVTTYGGNCLNFALLASGFIDLSIEAGQSAWDLAPFVPMIEQAGGVVTRIDGTSITADMKEGVVLVAATPELHGTVLEMLS